MGRLDNEGARSDVLAQTHVSVEVVAPDGQVVFRAVRSMDDVCMARARSLWEQALEEAPLEL